MRKLAIAAAVSVSLASITSESIALGLGEIEIFSALNQNLDAEIGLVSLGANELQNATVSLASDSAFNSAGVSITPLLNTLQFEIEQRPDGAAIVKVSSNAPVVEPFLNFLVEVDTGDASKTREYTVLLDPPAFAQQTTVAEPVADAAEIADSGAQIDLSSLSAEPASDLTVDAVNNVVLGTDAQPEVLLLESDGVESLDSILVVDQDTETAGEELNLTAELVDSPAPIIEDTSGGEDIAMDQVSLEDVDGAIFGSEAASAGDIEENIVDLGTLSPPVVVTETEQTEVAQQGLAVDIDLIPDNDSAAVEDVVETIAVADSSDAGESYVPEVTLEPVEAVAISDTETLVNVSNEPVADAVGDRPISLVEMDLAEVDQAIIEDSDAMVPDSDDITGESVDISGVIEDLNAEVPVSQVQQPVAQSPTPVVADTGATYTVKSQDTLWSIASRSKPSGVNTNQMMRLIVDANPSAFVNGDMNTMSEGAVLTLPGASIEGADTGMPATEVVEGNNATESITPTDAPQVTATVTTQDTTEAQLSSDLDEVNERMKLAQEELTSEAQQRDEISGRVVELEDSLSKMKKLITLRESELADQQNNTDSAIAEEPAEEVAEVSENAETLQEKFKELQDQISKNAEIAQERVAAQADADRNIAAAEAEAQSLKLANAEDQLRIQLAQLKLEKAELEKTAQADKLELVQQSEAQKAALLAEASEERNRILAQLDSEKQRIATEAEAERARIAADAEAERARLIADAATERERLSAEGDEMRIKLQALEEEKTQLLAQAELDKEQLAEVGRKSEQEQARLQAEAEAEKKKFEEESNRVKDKLAALQAEANVNLAQNANSENIDRNGAAATEDATGAVDVAVPAVVGGGLAAATQLDRVLGERKKVLAAGGGIALLGLLGAWALRRRKPTPTGYDNRAERAIDDDTRGKPVATQFDRRASQVDDFDNDSRPKNMGNAAVAASAAAAATGAVVATRDDHRRSDHDDYQRPEEPPEQRREDQPEDQREAQPDQQPQSVEPSVDTPETPPVLDSVLVDDTITEAGVYLRYGLHGQAEDLLKSAIEKSPDVPEYQAKLLETYHDQQNGPEFKKAAESFKDRFGESSSHWSKIAEMGRSLDSSDSTFSRVGATAGAAAATAAVVGTQAGNDAVAGIADETIDASATFNMADLEATGDLTDSLENLDEISLDEVDLASLDDDGTLNLEELTGDQMSGLDLGTLDLTNPEGGAGLDNLSLDDADLSSLDNVTSNVRSGLSADGDIDDSISRTDEMETMLDLAKAYIDMGDSDSAEGALKDIIKSGSQTQVMEAQDLLRKLK